MKKTFFGMIACFMIFTITSSLPAMGGTRKGFVLGFNVGGGLTSYTTTEFRVNFFDYPPYFSDEYVESRKSSMAFATDLKIGYGVTDQFLIYYANNVMWFGFKDPDWSESQFTIAGATKVGMSYFFKPEAPSFFTSAGIGLSVWSPLIATGYSDEIWLGLALSAGFGYEFSPHWAIELSAIWGIGGTDEDDDSGKNPLSVMFTIGYTLY